MSRVADDEFIEVEEVDEVIVLAPEPVAATRSEVGGAHSFASTSAAGAVSGAAAPTSLLDPVYELLDPNPDVRALFQQFDAEFFGNTLGSVECKFSKKMTLCAGMCYYQQGGYCSVRLSEPLLKLRPRADLVNTLLHEMIHAHLFLKVGSTDRDGHGPDFQAHMRRINAAAGTEITVYHSFHDEVDVYRTHVWRCSGPCLHKPPHFGLVKRAMNRPPGPTDWWFSRHAAECGGSYVKISEPVKAPKTKKGASSAAAASAGQAAAASTQPRLTTWLAASGAGAGGSGSAGSSSAAASRGSGSAGGAGPRSSRFGAGAADAAEDVSAVEGKHCGAGSGGGEGCDSGASGAFRGPGGLYCRRGETLVGGSNGEGQGGCGSREDQPAGLTHSMPRGGSSFSSGHSGAAAGAGAAVGSLVPAATGVCAAGEAMGASSRRPLPLSAASAVAAGHVVGGGAAASAVSNPRADGRLHAASLLAASAEAPNRGGSRGGSGAGSHRGSGGGARGVGASAEDSSQEEVLVLLEEGEEEAADGSGDSEGGDEDEGGAATRSHAASAPSAAPDGSSGGFPHGGHGSLGAAGSHAVKRPRLDSGGASGPGLSAPAAHASAGAAATRVAAAAATLHGSSGAGAAPRRFAGPAGDAAHAAPAAALAAAGQPGKLGAEQSRRADATDAAASWRGRYGGLRWYEGAGVDQKERGRPSEAGNAGGSALRSTRSQRKRRRRRR